MVNIESYLVLGDLGREVSVVAIVDGKEAWGTGIELGVRVVRRVQAGHYDVSVFL